MLNNFLTVLYFFLPAALANSSAVVLARIPIINQFSYPLDFYQSFHGQRILGDHKTIRGLIGGITIAIIIAFFQKILYQNNPQIANYLTVNYQDLNPFWLGLSLGGGALLGDCLKSFFKRRFQIPPGGNWFPFDYIDWVLGAIFCSYFYFQLSLGQYLFLLFFWSFFIHPLSDIFGSSLKKRPPIN